MASAVVIRVEFPKTYPVIIKTIRIESSMNVGESLKYIAESIRINYPGNVGLYLQEDKIWLDNSKTLNDYPQVQDQVVEYKELGSDSGGCSCVIC